MPRFWNSAILLLVSTGTLLGLSLPFGKIASLNGVSAITWSFLISAAAAVLILAVFLLSGGRMALDRQRLIFFSSTAFVSYALPNLLLFSVIPHVGAGYAGIMFTLSPILTLVLSVLLGVRKPNSLGMAGIGVGFIGAVMVALTRGEVGQPAGLGWVALALLIPVCLAIGNIYRTMAWPKETGPIELAIGSHAMAAILLALFSIFTPGGLALDTIARVPIAAVAQGLAAALMFAVFFRLQAVGGPVYLSQIGYVAAAVGLLSGTLLFGEHYQLLTWLGAGLITAGVALTTVAQAK